MCFAIIGYCISVVCKIQPQSFAYLEEDMKEILKDELGMAIQLYEDSQTEDLNTWQYEVSI